MPAVVKMPGQQVTGPLARASNTFAFDIYRRVAAAPGNFALSPASLSLALTMTWLGAGEQTATQIQRVLHAEDDAEATATAWGQVAAALVSPGRPGTLRIANRLFGDEKFPFEPAFIEVTRRTLDAPLEPTSFATASSAARSRINGWVAEKTEGRIKDLLSENAVSSATRLVLVNAIYFHADWMHAFPEAATTEREFSLTRNKKVSVPMMALTETVRSAKLDGLHVLELPYVGGETAMWIALPDAVDGLAAIESKLDQAMLERWSKALSPQRVAVTLPRFTLDPLTPLSLGEHLQALGMTAAFGPDADFSKMAKGSAAKELRVSEVFHKAFIKVDEKGTEAAAATAVVVARASASLAVPFMADHPFAFFIVDKPSGVLLFAGRVADPRS